MIKKIMIKKEKYDEKTYFKNVISIIINIFKI